MKRGLAILTATILLIAGCAKPPATDVAAKKNTERIVVKATEESALPTVAQATLQERYGIPERLQLDLQSKSGMVAVTVDAAISAPTNPMPVVRVEAAEFSQDMVDAAFHGLLGDTPVFQVNPIYTKVELDKLIAFYQAILDDENASQPDKDFAQGYLDEFAAEYADAPTEKPEPQRADATLQPHTELWSEGKAATHNEIVNVVSADNAYYFYVWNDRDNVEAVIDYGTAADGTKVENGIVNVSKNASLSFSARTDAPNYNYADDTVRLERDDTLPDYASATLRLTPAQAAIQAEDVLIRIGLGGVMGVSDIFLVSDYNPCDRPQPSGYGYRVVCTRKIGENVCAYLHSQNGSRQSGEQGGAFWGYESLMMALDDRGLLRLHWIAPMRVLETVSEATELEPFAEISEIAQKILPIAFEPDADETYADNVNVTIDRITLSLQRIAEQGELDRGLLIPAWNFYGTKIFHWHDNNGDTAHNLTFGSLLSINAIDGSVIDIAQGY